MMVSFVDVLGTEGQWGRKRWAPWPDTLMPPRAGDLVQLESASGDDQGEVVDGIRVTYVAWQVGGREALVGVSSK